MKHLFFVSLALGILSGTGLQANAQPSVNIEKITTGIPPKSTQRFIDGIEIKTGNTVSENSNIGIPPQQKAGITKNTKVNTEVSAIENCTSLQFKYAILLDMDVEDITNKVLFGEIEKWLDTRYRYGGNSEMGIDCSAYTGTLLADVYGLNVSRTSRAQYEECDRVERDDLKQGDLVFFNTRRRGRGVSHVGLYLGNGYFTHSGSSSGVTISNLSELYWSSKFIGGGRISKAATE